MANARQCDRCGDYYKRNYYKSESLMTYRAKEDDGDFLKDIVINTEKGSIKDYDLCDNCFKMLGYFLSNKKIIKFEGVI